MKKTLSMITILALAAGLATNAVAKSEKKNAPKSTRAVEDALKLVGGEHFPEKMRVKKVGPIEVGDTFYHVYNGRLDKLGFHIIIFDNYNNYLGYYASDFAPSDYEPGNIMIDSGDVDENNDTLFYRIPITEKKGIPAKISIGGMPSSFVKIELAEDAKTSLNTAMKGTGEEAEEDEELQPEYRDWIITFKGKKNTARAIFVKEAAGKVYLKLEANGKEKGFSLHMLSRDDQAYVKQFR